VDPAALFPTPAGDPDLLDAAVARMRGPAADLHRLGAAYTAEAGAMAAAWESSQASEAAAWQVRNLSTHTGELGRRTGAAAGALARYAGALREAIAATAGFQARAVTADREAIALVAAARHNPLPASDLQQVYDEHVGAALAGPHRHHADLIGELAVRAKACAAALQDAVPGFRPGMTPDAAAVAARVALGADLPLLHTADLIAAGGGGLDGLGPPADPKRRAAWWAALTADEQDRLAHADPRTYGAMPGLPAAGRDKANRILLDEDIAELEGKERAGTLTGAERKALAGARAVRTQLDQVVPGQRDPLTQQPLHAQLLIYDARAFGGQGRAAIVVGDLDTADNVAVCVPGLDSDVPGYMDNITGNALSLYREARKVTDPTKSTAVVAWMGYDAPGFSNVGSDNAADHGAILLAADVAGIQDSRAGDPPHLTVIGHSYGSTTTAVAASNDGMRVEEVVLIGSPGAGHANNVGDMGMDKGHVFVGANSSDTVTYRQRTAAGWDPLGEDPAGAEFGATRFEAEAIDRNSVPWMGDHSKYYRPNSESLHNVAEVVTGQPDKVIRAPYRDIRHGYPVHGDPEHDRTPTEQPS
jgi:hypothetical protein